MDWINEVKTKMKNNNKTFFSKNSIIFSELNCEIRKQNHRTMVLWAFEFASEIVQKLKICYPNEERPQIALNLSREWAMGKVKMQVAKTAILNVHSFAKEISSSENVALCHAIGQGCGVVHANGHAIGFAIYDLTAIIWRYSITECEKPIEDRIKQYIDRIYYWKNQYTKYNVQWAKFMLKD